MRDTLPVRVRFGDFALDLRTRELLQGERAIPLQEQPFQVLLMLAERGGGIVTREEIQKKLWPNDTVVEFDQSINTAIKKLRKALGDSAEEPKYIKTLAGHGYRLMVPVDRVAAASGDELFSQSYETALPAKPHSGSLTGKTISHYRVLEIVGGGGMGVVYRAEDLKLGRAVALKFLPEELGDNPNALERFEHEARAASALDHPNICSVYEFGEHEGQPFIVMQLLEGETLRDRLASAAAQAPAEKTFSVEQLLDVALQVATGLEAAHEKGIIHRDIKPANIFLTRRGLVKILDFGVAKLIEFGEHPEVAAEQEGPAIPRSAIDRTLAALHLTRTGMSMGTAAYMSPEQVRGEKVDARTDLFSFGLVLYEMATGQRAFGGDTGAIVHDAILNQTPVPVREMNSSLPAKVVTTIDKALEKDRERRYQSAAAMRLALEEAKSGKRERARKLWTSSAAVAILVVLAVAGWLHWRSRSVVKLADKDTIVLADFANHTGDAVFDLTLKQALSMQLQQSPFLNLVSDQKVNETLKLMNRAPGEKLTEATAREVCVRTSSKALLAGSISSRGERYPIEVRVLDCGTGDTLTSATAEAGDRNKVLSTLGEVGNQLRAKMGESLASVQKYDQPLEQATTSSLEALQAYTQAQSKEALQGPAAALPYYKLAVELDPEFGYAWARLGNTYMGIDETIPAVASTKRAFELRNRVSQREQFFIEGQYYDMVTNELDKMIATYREWTQVYPRDYLPHMRLCAVYRAAGRLEEALTEAQAARQIAPDNVAPATSVMLAYVRLNSFAQAKAVYEETRARKLDGPKLRVVRYWIAFFENDEQEMQKQVTEAMGKAATEDNLLLAASDTAGYHGQLQKARELIDRAVASAKRAGAPERAALWETWEAQREVLVGNPRAAQSRAKQALALSPGDDAKVKAALALAQVGEAARAQVLAGQLDPRPTGTLMHKFVLPIIRGAIALQEKNPAKAIEILQLAIPYELGGAAQCCLTPAYLRGLAYLQLGQGQQAAAEFQKLLDHPGVVTNNQQGSLAHLQLGRAQVMMGDRPAARKSYSDFLTLWKDADPDIPIYQQAKAEYARLR